jgi:hypothetical protein
VSKGSSRSQPSGAPKSAAPEAELSAAQILAGERGQFEISWMDRAGGRKARCPANPNYPDGIDADCTMGATGCVAQLPHPAPHLGVWIVRCKVCGFSAGITAAGRRDDPRSLKVPCRTVGERQ